MAIKKTLIQAVPYSEDGKVTRLPPGMKYEQGTEGQADYYTNEKSVIIDATITSGDQTKTNFTPKAEGDWTKKDLEDLCPIDLWDEIFAQQYNSVITNPPKEPVANNEFSIPS